MIDSKTERKPVMSGRPRLYLLHGQATYIERAYTNLGLSQARIAQEAGVSIPRVRRHLIEVGIYAPRPAMRTVQRDTILADAVEAYVEGDKVLEICALYDVNPSELYRELRAHNIPLRMKVAKEVQDGG